MQEVPPSLPQATAFSFHVKRGANIKLTDNKQTAERTADDFNGLVMSRDTIVENRVYEVNKSVLP